MRLLIEKKVLIGFIISLVAVLLTSVIAYREALRFTEDSQWVTHTYEVLTQLEVTLSTLKDAQRGMRGYVITDQEQFLAPYQGAISITNENVKRLKKLTADNPSQQRRLAVLEPKVADKLDYLREVIELRRQQGFEAAQKVISIGRGEESMDEIESLIEDMKGEEYALLKIRYEATQASVRRMFWIFAILNILVFAFLSTAYTLIRRDTLERNRLTAEREHLIQKLKDALAEVKQLQGILPICSYCRHIRNDHNSWQQMESYVAEHTEATFSHSICPSCYEKVVKPELEQMKGRKRTKNL
ncbi:MAG TPA: CHASE3 domain-containing protein [Pyrinomonadaceae bacterium]|nr:CHASE3 domain-containing protein [Pyrinomonadaceae bacterium]